MKHRPEQSSIFDPPERPTPPAQPSVRPVELPDEAERDRIEDSIVYFFSRGR